MRERRRFSRVQQPLDAQFRLYGELTSSWRSARTLNISANGLRFRSEDTLAPGTAIEIQIPLPGMREPLVVRGMVAWAQMQASGVTESGVEFMELSPDTQAQIDELVRFLSKDV